MSEENVVTLSEESIEKLAEAIARKIKTPGYTLLVAPYYPHPYPYQYPFVTSGRPNSGSVSGTEGGTLYNTGVGSN